MDLSGSSSLEKAKAAMRKIERHIEQDEPEDDDDLVILAALHSLISMAESLEAISTRSFKI